MHRRPCCLLWLVLAGLAPVACNPATSGQSPHLDVEATSDRDTIEEGDTVALKASVDGRTDHYAFHWESQTGGEARFADPDSPETEVGPLNVLGAYKFRVVASSPDGRFGQDFVVVTVVSEGTLNDNAEDDDNANEAENDNTEQNENEAENDNTEQNENEAEDNDNTDQNENEADENDNEDELEVDPDDVILQANAPRFYSAGLAASVIASQPPGGQEANYEWTVVEGQAEINDPAERQTRVAADQPGEVTVRVTMTVPEFDRSYEDDITISFEPEDTLTVYVTGPTEGLTGVPITLTASISNAPVGLAAQHSWELLEGEGEFNVDNTREVAFTPTSPGVVVVQVAINDAEIATAVDDYAFVAYPNPTIVLDGAVENFALVDQPITLSMTSTSFDDQDITYHWRVVSGPATLTGEDTTTPEVVVSAPETAELELTAEAVIDDLPRSGSRSVYVTAAHDFHPKVNIVVEGFGQIPLELDAEAAPITVANFLHYVDEQDQDGSLFHRVIADFIIQAGALTLDGDEPVELPPARDPIPNESDNGLSNLRGTVAMALLQDQPDSGSRSWFINLSDENDYLDESQFTVFGQVTGGGLDVADAISVVETGASDEPLDPVVITSIRRVDDG